jgi:hypothetical protein
MGSFAASLRKNPLNNVMALGERLSAMSEMQRQKQELADRRERLKQMIRAAGTTPGTGFTAEDQPMIRQAPRPQPLHLQTGLGDMPAETMMGKTALFGGDAFSGLSDTVEQGDEALANAGGSMRDRMNSIRSDKPRLFDENDLAGMVETAGDDETSQKVLEIAQKVNAARAAKKKRNFDIQSVGEGGYDILEKFDDAAPVRVGGRDPRVKPDMTPYESASLRLREQELLRGNKRDAQSAAGADKQWVKTENGTILYKTPEAGDVPYKESVKNTAEFNRLRTRAEKLEAKRNELENLESTGVMIINGEKKKIKVDDPNTQVLLKMQKDQADSALNDIYEQINALEADGETPGAGAAPSAGAKAGGKKVNLQKYMSNPKNNTEGYTEDQVRQYLQGHGFEIE